MRHIIAATDFSDLADHAVTTAAQLARAFEAKLILAHAFDTAPMGPASAYPMAAFATYPSAAAMRASAQKQLDEVKARLAAAGDIDISAELLDHPSAWAALCDLAERRGADLVVIGTHGRTAISRLLLGSVAETTLRHAPCSVLAVREAPARFGRILVGTDFSPASKPALVQANALAKRLGAEVTLIHVYVAPRPLWGEAQVELGDIDTQLRQSMVDVHRDYFDVPFEIALMQSDNAALAMGEYAAAHDMDLVVVSTHGRTGIKRMLMGSVAEKTVRHAPCAVWVARQ